MEKIILDYTITLPSVHDSNEISKLVKDDDKIVYADSAYKGTRKIFAKMDIEENS